MYTFVYVFIMDNNHEKEIVKTRLRILFAKWCTKKTLRCFKSSFIQCLIIGREGWGHAPLLAISVAPDQTCTGPVPGGGISASSPGGWSCPPGTLSALPGCPPGARRKITSAANKRTHDYNVNTFTIFSIFTKYWYSLSLSPFN